uniref:Uncharacterized protein n=1 Tax=Rhizophora mucronata TaxID=61149 RepID=A0A2P2PZE5_RHIMU
MYAPPRHATPIKKRQENGKKVGVVRHLPKKLKQE